MPAFYRKFIHRALRRFDLKIVRVKPDEVSGIDLQEDVGLILNNDEPVCFDVGANRGQTIRMLQRGLKQPRIHAFEPSSAMFANLKSQWFPRGVSFHQCALGEKPAQLEFINYRSPALSSLLPLDPSPENRFHDVDVVDREMVEVSTVDEFMARLELPALDLLKVDTQGFDLAVLKGAGGALANGRIRAVLVELNFVRMYQGQASAQEITEYLAQHGLYLIDCYDKAREGHTLGWCCALFGRR